MKSYQSDKARYHAEDGVVGTVQESLDLISAHPDIIAPVRDLDDQAREIFAGAGFKLLPTVKTTILIYDTQRNCYMKILHALTLKNRIAFHFSDRAGRIHRTAAFLAEQGIKLSPVLAYGTMGVQGLPFFVMEEVQGESLYAMSADRRAAVTPAAYQAVIDQLALLHSRGYWLSDAHPAHVFIRGNEFSGFIDIDGIRKNRPFRLKNLAKDIAGLNHPCLCLPADLRKELFDRYVVSAAIEKTDEFKAMVTQHTHQRWKTCSER